MFIWEHFDIPTVSGDQLIVTSADPLAPVPIKWCNSNGDTTAAFYSPNVLARDYEANGLADMVYKMRKLGIESKQYRVVGHGLKVWVSKSTTIARGNIEAGQYDIGLATNANQFATSYTARGSVDKYWYYDCTTSNDATVGPQMTALTTGNINRMRSAIETAKDQEIGFLAADEGATVRWTDTNNWQFQQTYDRGVCFMHNQGWAQSIQPSYTTFQPISYLRSDYNGMLRPQAEAPTAALAANIMVFQPTMLENYSTNSLITGTSGAIYTDVNKLGTIVTRKNTAVPTATFWGLFQAPNGATGDQQIAYYNANYDKLDSTNMTNYFQNPDKQFNKGLYVDVSGVDTSQVLTVQVCWHIEYVPKNTEPWSGEASPVDVSFETIDAMARNRLAFPIVVKGHSFFSSLRKAFGKALDAASKIFSKAAPLAQGLLSSIPDPRAQAAAMGLTGAMAMHDAFKRQRDE